MKKQLLLVTTFALISTSVLSMYMDKTEQSALSSPYSDDTSSHERFEELMEKRKKRLMSLIEFKNEVQTDSVRLREEISCLKVPSELKELLPELKELLLQEVNDNEIQSYKEIERLLSPKKGGLISTKKLKVKGGPVTS